MEMECLFFGESEKAFFKFEDLEKNRKIIKPLYPKSYYSMLKDANFKQESKKDGEIRLLCCDIAGMAGRANDASAYIILRLIPNKNGYDRHASYIESMEGGHTVTQAIRIRQLFNEFECDFVVLDTQNIGLAIFDQLCQPLYDKDFSIEYDPWTCINDEKMAERCTYPNAAKIVYSIKGNSQFNSDAAINLRDGLKRGKVKLLVSEIEGKEALNKVKGYSSLSLEDRLRYEVVFVQTTLLVNEMINLEGERTDAGLIKLREPSTKRKDRYSSLSYGNYIATDLERELLQHQEKDDDIMDYLYIN